METTWGQSYPYQPYNPSRAEDRSHGTTSPTLDPLHPSTQSHSHSPEDSHRRSQTYPHHMNYLPHQSLPSISTYQHQSYPYPPYVPYPPTSSPTSLLSPYPNARQPPPHSLPYESPRLVTDGIPSTGYSSSPNLPHHHISPNSPPAHLAPPNHNPQNLSIHNSHSGSSTSPYPVHNTRGTKRNAQRKPVKHAGGSQSEGEDSWEDEMGPPGKKGGMGEFDSLEDLTEDQPWGMPQHIYKDLNPKDKKQVRNKIGARRFRAKKKAHIQCLEDSNRALLYELLKLRRANSILHRAHDASRTSQGLPPTPLPNTRVEELTDESGNVLKGVDVDALIFTEGTGLGLTIKGQDD